MKTLNIDLSQDFVDRAKNLYFAPDNFYFGRGSGLSGDSSFAIAALVRREHPELDEGEVQDLTGRLIARFGPPVRN